MTTEFSTSELIQYIKDNKLNLHNDFMNSILENYEKYDKLTEKQNLVVCNNILKHKFIKKMFSIYHVKTDIIKSLESFFNKTGFLTPKQYDLLLENHDRYLKNEEAVQNIVITNKNEDFMKSIRRQFQEKGFLTTKQYNAILK
jgi:hypothetical protein